MPINLLMEWIKSVFLAPSLSHLKTSGELKPSGKCLLWATLWYCWKYLFLNTKKETIFHPPGILRSICVAGWGRLLAHSILPQAMQSCSLTMQEKPAEQRAIPFIYSGSRWSCARLGVRHAGADPSRRQAEARSLPSLSNAPPQSSQSFLHAGTVARTGFFMLI